MNFIAIEFDSHCIDCAIMIYCAYLVLGGLVSTSATLSETVPSIAHASCDDRNQHYQMIQMWPPPVLLSNSSKDYELSRSVKHAGA